MALISFNEWKLLNEGKKGKMYDTSEPKLSDVETLRKTGRLSLEIKKKRPSRGHQEHLSGAGPHNDRPRGQKSRAGEKKSWRKEQGLQ